MQALYTLPLFCFEAFSQYLYGFIAADLTQGRSGKGPNPVRDPAEASQLLAREGFFKVRHASCVSYNSKGFDRLFPELFIFVQEVPSGDNITERFDRLRILEYGQRYYTICLNTLVFVL